MEMAEYNPYRMIAYTGSRISTKPEEYLYAYRG
jgi:hypothetical protein